MSSIKRRQPVPNPTPEIIANITAEFDAKLTENHPRNDYKELLKLVLVYVGSLNGNF